MNFENDDILGDILSDGSNDSFFDDPKLTTKKPQKTVENQRSTASSSDWLQFTPGPSGDKTQNEPDLKDDWLGLKTEKPPGKTRKPFKKISFEDNNDGDILTSLELNKNVEPKEAKNRKSEFLESILKPSKLDEPKEIETKSIGSLTETTIREGRRKRTLSGLDDPLGLFTKESDPTANSNNKFQSSDVKDIETISNPKSTRSSKESTSRSAPNLTELPDWLGGSKTSEPEPDSVSFTKSKSETNLSEKTELNNKSLNTILSSLFATQSELQQKTAVDLQQQEVQLLMALQMKKYEEHLTEIQHQQREIIQKQDQQFNSLLERMFFNQNTVESDLRHQQARINNHIQLLMTKTNFESSNENDGNSPQNKLLEDCKQRQNVEVFLLEESYKKQIAILEDNLHQTETRLKSEIEELEKRHEKSVESIEVRYNDDMKKLRKKIVDLEEEHEMDLKRIREAHTRTVEDLKNEHNSIIANFKESKRNEDELLRDTRTFGSKLDTNLEFLLKNSVVLEQVSNDVKNGSSVLTAAREESFKAKEKDIELMRASLEKCRESAEKDKVQLLSLVRTLELKLAEQCQASREESWALQQAASTFASRAAALDRETEFNRNALERERTSLKALKESMLAEQEKLILELTEEKLAIAAEKSRLKTSLELASVSQNHRQEKAELEAALKVAKEAEENAEKESEKLRTRIIELESLKRTLRDKERTMTSREAELARLEQRAEELMNQAEEKHKTAKMIESNCQEKLKEMQSQYSLLAIRERKLAEEKILLSKERIALNDLARRGKFCVLCSTNVAQDVPKNDGVETMGKIEFNENNEIAQFQKFSGVMSETEILRLHFQDKYEDN